MIDPSPILQAAETVPDDERLGVTLRLEQLDALLLLLQTAAPPVPNAEALVQEAGALIQGLYYEASQRPHGGSPSTWYRLAYAELTVAAARCGFVVNPIGWQPAHKKPPKRPRPSWPDAILKKGVS